MVTVAGGEVAEACELQNTKLFAANQTAFLVIASAPISRNFNLITLHL